MKPAPLSPEIQACIHKFAREISAGTHLEQEFEEELAGHVEDKIRGYLSGADPITEDDALLLARRHFGNPQVVRTLLQETHAGLDIREVRSALAQRVAAAISAMFLSAALAQILQQAWLQAIDYQLALTESPGSFLRTRLVILFLFHLVLSLVGPAVMYFLLRRKRNSPATRTRSMSQLRLRALTSMLIFVTVTVGMRIIYFYPFSSRGGVTIPYYYYSLAIVWLQLLTPALSALVWVWWCDRKPFRLASVVFALLGWVLTTTLITQITLGTSMAAVYTSGIQDYISQYLYIISIRHMVIIVSGIAIAGIFDFLYRRQSRRSEAQLTTGHYS